MSDFYQQTIEATLRQLKVDSEAGLSDRQAREILKELGPNTIAQEKKTSVWKLLWHNVNNLIVYLLLAAALLSFIMGDLTEAVAVLIAVLLAVLTGFLTELKAQKSIDSLQEMIYTTATVIRQGEIQKIRSADVVVGDIMVLAKGDAIAADGRIISSSNFACIESALTGESEAVDKDSHQVYEEEVPLGDRLNMVFAGTAVTRGSAHVVVTETAMQTEVGKISSMLTGESQEKTPLDIELDQLGKVVIVAALIAGAAVLVAGVLTSQPFVQMIHISIILTVAAIPEAMPAVSTITLSRGMRIMAEHQALVKTLSAVETLGATSVICSDKTGTLTENQMMAAEIILENGKDYEISGKGYDPKGTISRNKKAVDHEKDCQLSDFISNGLMCNSAFLRKKQADQYEVIGDPTDGALVVLGEKIGLTRKKMEENFTKVGELPFDSANKFMITVYENGDRRLIIKGAFDVILGLVDHSAETAAFWQEKNDRIAAKGRRVLAIATIENYRGGTAEESLTQSLNNLKIQGLVGIVDPPRSDVKESIRVAQQAGIKVKMITGDHPKTASMIAKEIGLAEYEKTLTGRQIDQKAKEADFAHTADITAVFARVSPENKLQIVRSLRQEGEIVSMTGDGVNDAPALNGADIGVAMGVRGTEVAKESADMILTDDRFSTIVEAIKEGRIIFDNIKKYVSFLFSCNMVEIITIFLSVILLMPMPIEPLHILFLNLVIDIAPAMALAFEPAEENIMNRKPRAKSESLVNRRFLSRIILSGIVIGLTAFGLFFLLQTRHSLNYAQTAVFSFMAVAQLMHIFNVRKQRNFGLDRTLLKNLPLIGAMGLSIVLQLSAVYLPFMNDLLGTTPLRAVTWLMILVAAVLSMALVHGLKSWIRNAF